MEHERIIYVLECLSRGSDDKRGVTIADIQQYLRENANLGNVSPLTIRRDIDRLTGIGHDIRRSAGEHNTAYYSLNGNGFTFNEIRFIVDSVSINKFLTPRQKQRLIKKFEGMCSDAQIRQLVSRISLDTNASPSLDLLENLDKIHRLISERRKINFQYGKFDTHKQVNYYDKRRDMLPVRVVYSNERIYLRCWNSDRDEFRTYRVDRMKNITGGEVAKAKPPKDARYDGFVADIFPPERFETVTLRVKRYLLDEMLEQFGEFAGVRDDFDSPDCAVVRARCGINRQFYLWLMRYGDGIEVISPADVREGFAEQLKLIVEKYIQ
ncbi:MAG: WYL domain-containing protein [Ruminococcus sp.]|nr:WYL domain-containing protein [Ruminococcus sp.]